MVDASDVAVDSNEEARYEAAVTKRKMSDASLSARVGPASVYGPIASSAASRSSIDVAATLSAVVAVGERVSMDEVPLFRCSEGSSKEPATLMMLPSLRDKIKVDSTPGRLVNDCRVFATCSDNDNGCSSLSQRNILQDMQIDSYLS